MKKITKAEAYRRINATKGKLFSVTFTKKDGSMRDMVCRCGVQKGVTGVGMNYQPEAYELVTVFDMKKDSFRMIPLNRLRRIKIAGVESEVS